MNIGADAKLETFTPVQGMHCCANETGDYVLKSEYAKVTAALAAIHWFSRKCSNRDTAIIRLGTIHEQCECALPSLKSISDTWVHP